MGRNSHGRNPFSLYTHNGARCGKKNYSMTAGLVKNFSPVVGGLENQGQGGEKYVSRPIRELV
jgi:hypothetical protein